jgi:mTERF domain-containing protein
MLRLRSCIAALLLSSTSAAPISPLHRLLCAAAAASPSPSFAVEEYLVEHCGLTRPQALKASSKISHVKHPSNPDAVVAFLAGLGLSRADVAAVVAKDPRLLCASVERTLAPNVLKLIGLGLSRSEVARLVSLGRVQFRTRSVASRVQYFLPIFGSFENLLRIVRRSSYLLSSDVERMAKPNVAFLRECGIDAAGIASLCVAVPRILCTKPEHVRAMAARCEGLGVPLGSGMFRLAMRAVSFLTEDTIADKVEHLKNTFRWSDAEVGIAVCNFPTVLNLSKDMLRRKSEFLLSEVGLEPAYILHRPVMLGLSLERRLRPRYYVLKFLKENGLLDPDRDYFSAVRLTEKVFMEKFICPHKEAAPYLAEDYAAACRGEMSTRFRFT